MFIYLFFFFFPFTMEQHYLIIEGKGGDIHELYLSVTFVYALFWL